MSTRSTNRPPTGGAAPPPAAPSADPVDEGPMRRELLRQIAQLETELSARRPDWSPTCTTPKRGPALQPTAELERLRDELLAALDESS
jgi:hypothetical protein